MVVLSTTSTTFGFATVCTSKEDRIKWRYYIVGLVDSGSSSEKSFNRSGDGFLETGALMEKKRRVEVMTC